ncbi:ImmA/IrrE family metallo-endopeptidase [Azospirillum sp. YIM B02556]|uniref:ImmA/IrrE family metallo-endopeptidase n=1 Tax=Azospirillum endophyticum TaxID=2800326 RepID=A0ABS1EZ18_9PROT|nr:ImmA/IrrE family metallo-endopeptidase [Azospirillum endophyticum]
MCSRRLRYLTGSPDASGPRRSDGSSRKRFSIAHEIGHWILGHIPYGRGGRHETEANAFAARSAPACLGAHNALI